MASSSNISVSVTSDISDVTNDLNDLSRQFDRMADGADQANEELGRIGSVQRLEALSAVGDKLGTMADGIIDFGMKSVEASAKWQAINSQWSQVWGEMSIQADVAVNKIADNTGMLPNLLKPSFIQIGAFAKTTGASTADALDLSTRAMIASADGAAFMDKSISEVTESMQSFLKGNFENDAALGISATETTRNAKANELYGASFIELSESQKQLTLLAMVEEGNQLSGALGQAARESDGLETKMSNMNQSIEDFMAQVGNEVLPIFIESISKLAEIVKNASYYINAIPEPVKQFIGGVALGIVVLAKLIPVITAVMLGITALGTAMLPVTLIVGAIILAIGLAVVAFNNWDTAVKIFSDAWAVVWAWLQETFPETIAMITEIVNWLVENWDTIKNVVITVWDAIVTSIMGALETIWIIIQNVMTTIDIFIGTTWENIKTIVMGVWDAIKIYIQIAIDLVSGIIKTVMAIIKGDWEGAWNAIKETFSNVFNGILKLGSSIMKTVRDVIDNSLNGIAKAFTNILNGTFKTVESVFNNIKNTISSVIENVKKLFDFKLKFPEISIPHIKLPHFSLSGEFNPLKGKLPKIGIEWYRKGGIMTSPTAFGMNGSNMMVGGEAGNEAILPLNHRNLSVIGAQIADTMEYSSQQPIVNNVTVNIDGNIDSDQRINELTSRVSETLLTQYNQQYTWN